jgi:hypothetical protein
MPQAPPGTPDYNAEVAEINAETAPLYWAQTAEALNDAVRETAGVVLPALGVGLIPVALIAAAALWMVSRR